MSLIENLKQQVRGCHLCADVLPFAPNPIIQLAAESRILIAGQAPGKKVQQTGIPFNDPSGDRLRHWLGVSKASFYDEKQFALLPMGFCYPGTGRTGDRPPRSECAAKWRDTLLSALTHIELTIVLGHYAMAYHLPNAKGNLTHNVAHWQDYWPDLIVLPHPSPRNNRWLKLNPWFETEILPALKIRVHAILNH